MASRENVFNAIGGIIIFSFFSVVILFISLVILASVNNYALQDLYGLTQDLTTLGVMQSQISEIADTFGGLDFIAYLDKLWFISFISLLINSVIYSYMAKRSNYFGIFSFAVFGLIIVTYLGGIFIQLTNWFKTNVLFAVFPNIASQIPFFAWYLNYMGIINLIIIVICIIANYIDIDFEIFNKNKGGGLEEV